MRIHSFPVSPLQANCYLISGDDHHCIIVDPGLDALEAISASLDDTGLIPTAALLTHGHIDHAGGAHAVGERFQIETLCHEADHPMVTDPKLGLGPALAPLLQQWGVGLLPKPRGLAGYPENFFLAGLSIVVHHLPGHTPGSVGLQISTSEHQVFITGDVLFAGSIGRTDLPGGSMAQMSSSLRTLATLVPEQTTLLPGHGPKTTLSAELTSNPHLMNVMRG